MSEIQNNIMSFYNIDKKSEFNSIKKAINKTNIGYELDNDVCTNGTPDISFNSMVFIDETCEIWHCGKFYGNLNTGDAGDYPTISLLTCKVYKDTIEDPDNPGEYIAQYTEQLSYIPEGSGVDPILTKNLEAIEKLIEVWPNANVVLLANPKTGYKNNTDYLISNYSTVVLLSYIEGIENNSDVIKLCGVYVDNAKSDSNLNMAAISTYVITYKKSDKSLSLSTYVNKPILNEKEVSNFLLRADNNILLFSDDVAMIHGNNIVELESDTSVKLSAPLSSITLSDSYIDLSTDNSYMNISLEFIEFNNNYQIIANSQLISLLSLKTSNLLINSSGDYDEITLTSSLNHIKVSDEKLTLKKGWKNTNNVLIDNTITIDTSIFIDATGPNSNIILNARLGALNFNTKSFVLTSADTNKDLFTANNGLCTMRCNDIVLTGTANIKLNANTVALIGDNISLNNLMNITPDNIIITRPIQNNSYKILANKQIYNITDPNITGTQWYPFITLPYDFKNKMDVQLVSANNTSTLIIEMSFEKFADNNISYIKAEYYQNIKPDSPDDADAINTIVDVYIATNPLTIYLCTYRPGSAALTTYNIISNYSNYILDVSTPETPLLIAKLRLGKALGVGDTSLYTLEPNKKYTAFIKLEEYYNH